MSDINSLLWVEKYRPKSLSDCILPIDLTTIFNGMIKEGTIPNMMLYGKAGTGKTTVARALANDIDAESIIINCSEENGIDTLRTKIRNYASTVSLSGNLKVVILDEFDYANAQSIQPALRGAIEEFAKNCRFIMTCNYKNRIIEPLHSRCAVIEFSLKNGEKAKMASAFFKRVQNVLQSENVEYEDKVIAELTKKHFPDFRRILNELQRYSQFGKIDTGILAQIGDVSIDEVVKFIRDKDFGAIRKWVATNEVDSGTLFRKIYDSMYDVMKPQSIPQAVLILADYQYKSAFVADHEINTVACLTEIMVNCEFV